jgi:hypothetical protein
VSELIALSDLPEKAPWWPFSPWWTRKLCRDRQLRHINTGRRLFVTPDMLRAYIEAHVVKEAG